MGDGRVLVAGGDGLSGASAAVEVFTPDGVFAPVAPMNVARSHHTATVLADGRVLVAGGVDATGAATDSAEIYSPAADAWIPVPAGMAEARTGHTATRLDDGRVLVVGGESNGVVSATFEVFDPASGAFAVAGALAVPRRDHAAAALHDGRVVIAGGWDGANVLRWVDVFDPATGTTTPAGDLAVARAGHTATTLLTGDVLIAGGNDRSADIAATEIFRAADGTLTFAGAMSGARRAHRALLLPDNASVLFVGGISGELAVSSVEMYVPWTGQFVAGTPMSAARAHVATSPAGEGVLLAAGGDGLASAEVHGFATIKTDRDDYAPGEYVTMTGSGWQPGENVRLVLREVPTLHIAQILNAVADANGNIVEDRWAPERHHIGVRFYLTATGETSGLAAQTTFTDGPKVGAVDVGVQSPNPVEAGSSATYPITVNRGSGSGSSGKFTVNLSVTTETPNGVSYSFSPLSLELGPQTGSATATLTVTTTSAAVGTTQFTVKASTSDSDWATGAGTLVVSAPSKQNQTITFDTLPPKTYGDEPFTVTATSSSNLTVSFSSQTTNVCTATNSTVHIVSAGICTIRASQAGNDSYNAAPDVDQSFTVSKKLASVTPTGGSKTYGVADPTLTGTLIGFLASDNVTAIYSRTPGETVAGGPYAITATLSPAGVLGNYDITYTSVAFTITPKAASVTPNAASKTYGDADPTLTGTLAGFFASDNVTATYSRTAGETVVGSPYTISATLSPMDVLGNYAITYNTAAFTITPKGASVTPTATGKTYGDADPTLVGTLNGFLAGDSVTAAYSRTAGETVAGSPYTITATLSPADVLGNYNVTYNTAAFTITPKAASVTPNAASKTYGDADPAFSGTLVGFLDDDNVTTTYSRATGETVGSYTISATLTPESVLGNYSVTYNTALFTINRKAASVTPTAASKTYGDADPTLTGSLSGFLAADNVTAIYSRTAGETVAGGPYTISATLSPAGVLGNYTITYSTALFTINRKAASVTPTAASKTYGDADPTLTGALSGFLAADNVTASYSRAAGETVAGGPYTISATLSPAGVLGSYEITYNTAAFTIKSRPITVTADSKTKILGAADPALTYQVSGTLVGSDAIAGELRRVAGEEVGTYAIEQGTLDLSANYALTFVGANLKIEYAPAGTTCLGEPGHAVLQPVNGDGTSVFKQKSTVPVKFRVCDANGNSVGTPGVVKIFTLVERSAAAASAALEEVLSTTPDTAFRWSASDQHWIFNLSTKNLAANNRYRYRIMLNDGTPIDFEFVVK